MNIEVKLDDQHKHKLDLHTPATVNEILNKSEIVASEILCLKANNNMYLNPDYRVTGDLTLNCLTFSHPEGYRTYQDSAIFILAKAIYSLFGSEPSLVVEHSIGDGVYCEVFGGEAFTEDDCLRVSKEMQRIVESALPIERLEVGLEEAEDIFSSQGRTDVLKNLSYFPLRNLVIYRCGKFYDFYFRPLAANTNLIHKFDLVYQAPGFILRFPVYPTGELAQPFVLPQKLFKMHQEHDKWLSILKVHNMIDLNHLIDDYEISQFILVEEALHEKKIAEIASTIAGNPDIKLVLIAGPSSSGKTTFAKRLSVQMLASKKTPLVIGLDDYFLNRDKTPRKPNGDFDFESIEALDLEYLNRQLIQLLEGETIELPKFNFNRGIRCRSHQHLRMKKDNLIVMEGIHGLNDRLTAQVPAQNKAKIYVSALNQLNIDKHNRIPTTDCRLLRRIVRDFQYRGYSAEETLLRWNAVREGEDRYIFPYQENADFMFNSSLTYELGVLKKHAWKLLKHIQANSAVYTEAQRILQLLSFIRDIPDILVPYNSIIREFTNGSIFRY